MAIDRKAWYRRLHLMHAMDKQELHKKYNLKPMEGPIFMGHDNECEECSSIRSANEEKKSRVKEHAENLGNLNHGNNCPYCNDAILTEITKNDHFDIGSGEGK